MLNFKVNSIATWRKIYSIDSETSWIQLIHVHISRKENLRSIQSINLYPDRIPHILHIQCWVSKSLMNNMKFEKSLGELLRE